MRSILLYVQDDDCMEARLQVALDLCRQFEGHLTCLQAIAYDLGLAGDLYHPVAAQVATDLHKAAKEFRAQLEPRLKAEDISWDWIASNGLALHQIPRFAPLHDLVVLGAHNATGKTSRPSDMVGELVSVIRAPVLITPASTGSLSLNVPAVIAWNGAPEAAHALQSAMPMLSRASQVHVLTVSEEQDAGRYDLPPTSAAKYLARHGVEAEIVELPQVETSLIAQHLIEAAKVRKAGYLVMGAYGHSRFRERILGGVTRDMLRDPRLPLLLNH